MAETKRYSGGIQLIVDEHTPLRQQMTQIRAMAQKLESAQADAEQEVEQLNGVVLAFIRQVEAHSEAEDEALSPLLCKHLGPDARPIAGNAEQHNKARRLLQQYREEMQAYRAGNKSRLAPLAASLLAAIDGLTEHFDTEEDRLFPLAEKTLPEGDKAALLAALLSRRYK